MAYQNVGIPRIYLNIPEYLASTGVEIDSIFRTLPVKPNLIEQGNYTFPFISEDIFEYGTKSYIALLGHDMHDDSTFAAGSNDGQTDIINGTSPFQKGFSIFGYTSSPLEGFTLGKEENISSILFGIYYDFPHSPDLNVTLTYSYDGVKEITTRGGSTLTNSFYTKPPYSFEIGDVETQLAKSGRRIWDLSFSYLSDDNVFPDNAGLSNENPDSTNLTLLQDDTLQRVIHLTNGGQIPFLFQSDNSITENFQNQLAICKFDMNSFKFSQVAPNMYSISIRIREVW